MERPATVESVAALLVVAANTRSEEYQKIAEEYRESAGKAPWNSDRGRREQEAAYHFIQLAEAEIKVAKAILDAAEGRIDGTA